MRSSLPILTCLLVGLPAGAQQPGLGLDAQTVIRLKRQGVPEDKIRALIVSRSSDALGSQAPRLTVEARPFAEPAPEHPGGHQHFVITLDGIEVVVLRDEAGSRSPADRAAAVVERLRRLVLAPDGHFVVVAAPRPTVVYRARGSDNAVIEVSAGDVAAFGSRSLREVSAHTLAAYWAALLDDCAGLLAFGRPPEHLGRTHLGESLSRLGREIDAAPAGTTIDQRVAAALDHLPPDDKQHLLELPARVPMEFKAEEGVR